MQPTKQDQAKKGPVAKGSCSTGGSAQKTSGSCSTHGSSKPAQTTGSCSTTGGDKGGKKGSCS